MAKQLFYLLCVGLVVFAAWCNGQTAQGTSQQRCGRNEEYKCRQSCPPETCISLIAKFNCLQKPCEEGCFCKDGYLRAKAGAPCEPYTKCEQWRNNTVTCGQNEEYKCKRLCPPETCNSLVAFYKCADVPCQYKCFCKDGYLRKDDGAPCRPSEECQSRNCD